MSYWRRFVAITAGGLIVGFLLCADFLIARVFGGGDGLSNTTVWIQSTIYLLGGLIGGAVIGILQILLRWSWGWAILGSLATAPTVLALSYLVDPTLDSVSRQGIAVISLLVGGGGALYLRQSFSDQHNKRS